MIHLRSHFRSQLLRHGERFDNQVITVLSLAVNHRVVTIFHVVALSEVNAPDDRPSVKRQKKTCL